MRFVLGLLLFVIAVGVGYFVYVNYGPLLGVVSALVVFLFGGAGLRFFQVI